MPIKTNIYLTPEQHQALRQLAYERRSSIAELVRQSVDRFVEEAASTITLPEELLARLDAEAKVQGESRTAVVQRLLTLGLERRPGSGQP